MGEYEKAEPLFLRTRSNWARTLGESHPDFAFCIDHLAKLYTVTGEFENSERLHIQALEIYRNAWGEIHPNCAITIDNLALLHRTMGDHAEAELLHRKALNIWKQTVGESDHDYARCLSSLATVLAEAGQLREAAQCFDESRRISRTHIDRVLPGLSETEQLVFLNVKDHADLHAALSLGLRCADDSEIAEISAGWLLNSKALVQDTMSQQVRLATISQSPEVVKLSADLRAVRSRLARLSLDPSAIENVTSFRSEVENLHQRERELSKAVGRAQGEIFHTEAWIEVDEVLHTLGEDTVFIDIARIQVTNFDSSDESVPSNAHSYVAWLIPAPGRGEIKIVNLGSASEIEAAIQLARAGMNDPQDLILERGEREVENDLVEMLQQLSSMILRPLLDNISDQRHLILSPDSALMARSMGCVAN